MKKTFKTLSFSLLALLLINSGIANASVNSSVNSTKTNAIDIKSMPSFSTLDEARISGSLPDNFIVKSSPSSNVISSYNSMTPRGATDNQTIYTLKSRTNLATDSTINGQAVVFVGYHPSWPNWSNRSGYNVSVSTSNVTLSVGLNFAGVLFIGLNQASSGDTSFYAANSGRDNKLGVYSPSVSQAIYSVKTISPTGVVISTGPDYIQNTASGTTRYQARYN